MPSQADVIKVKKYVIDVISRNYGASFDPDAMNDFISAFAETGQSILQSAMMQVLDEQKKRPTIAHIKEAIRAKSKSSAIESELAKKVRQQHDDMQDEAMKYMLDFMGHGDRISYAVKNGYYTQLTQFLFASALAQIKNNKAVQLEIPNPIPENWALIGKYIAEVQRKRAA